MKNEALEHIHDQRGEIKMQNKAYLLEWRTSNCGGSAIARYGSQLLLLV